MRIEAIRGYVRLKDDLIPTEASADDIKIRQLKADQHETPREITFMDSLPMMETGTILRNEQQSAVSLQAPSIGLWQL